MDNPSRQPDNSTVSPAHDERVTIDDYRGPMNGPTSLPPNVSITAVDAKAEPGNLAASQRADTAAKITQALAMLGWVCSVGSGSGTLYVFFASLILTGSSKLHYVLFNPVGATIFCVAIVGFSLCLAALVRSHHSSNLRRMRVRSWIGLVLSGVTILVSLLTYLGALQLLNFLFPVVSLDMFSPHTVVFDV